MLSLTAAMCSIFGATITTTKAHADVIHTPIDPGAGEPSPQAEKVIRRARKEVERKVRYQTGNVPVFFENGKNKNAHVYPGGDIDPDISTCTDLVVRAFRATGVDLQWRIHEDVADRREAYPYMVTPDTSIDHRRVPNLQTYLAGHALPLPLSLRDAPASFHPGDIVIAAWKPCPNCTPDHIGIVSDRKSKRGLPMIIHNGGPVAKEEDALDQWRIIGHYRLDLD